MERLWRVVPGKPADLLEFCRIVIFDFLAVYQNFEIQGDPMSFFA